jgi:hypothetical protein
MNNSTHLDHLVEPLSQRDIEEEKYEEAFNFFSHHVHGKSGVRACVLRGKNKHSGPSFSTAARRLHRTQKSVGASTNILDGEVK